MDPDGLDWDVLTRLAAEGFEVSLAAAPLGHTPPAPTAPRAASDGVRLERPPVLPQEVVMQIRQRR